MSVDACAALVERGDPDRFAATMAAPVAARARLWPLYAFNLEIARAPYASPEPLVAEMRLQWWVDMTGAMAAGQGGVTGDVAQCLAQVVAQTGLPAGLLVGMAEARRWEVWTEPFADAAHFADYLDATAGNLMWAAALALGAGAGAEPVVRDFAWGAGLANWLRALPELAAKGRKPLVDGRASAVQALARDGLARIAAARANRHLLARTAVPALWPGFAARALLKQALAEPDRVAEGRLQISDFQRSSALIGRAMMSYW